MDGIIKVFYLRTKWCLSYPNGVLGTRVPSSGITFANTRVNKLLNSTADGDGNELNGNSKGGTFSMARPWGIISRLLERVFIISNQ